MSDETPETVEVPVEYLEEVYVVCQEQVILDLLRRVDSGADPDLAYAEAWANNSFLKVLDISCECTCDCEEEECEHECSCGTSEIEEDGEEDPGTANA